MNVIKSQNFSKKFINYFEVFLVSINALAIITILVIVHKNIIVSIIGILLSCGNLVLVYYIFIINNPLYKFFCYVLSFSGVLFFIPSLWIDLRMGFLFLPNIIYIVVICKGTRNASALGTIAKYQFLSRFAADYAFNAKRLSQQWDNINPELELIRQKHRELLEKKYNSKKIIITSLLLSFSWIVIFVLYIVTYVSL